MGNGRIFANNVTVVLCANINVRNSIVRNVDRLRAKRTVSTISKEAGANCAEDQAYVSMEEKSIDARIAVGRSKNFALTQSSTASMSLPSSPHSSRPSPFASTAPLPPPLPSLLTILACTSACFLPFNERPATKRALHDFSFYRPDAAAPLMSAPLSLAFFAACEDNDVSGLLQDGILLQLGIMENGQG
jgi:hypothetical protein